MKCKHCGSEWTSTRSTTVCPFCQKSLAPDASTPKTMTDALVRLREMGGTELFGRGKALVSSFKDIAPELKKEHTLLTYLEKCDGMTELYAVKDQPVKQQDTAAARVVCRMTDELMVSEAAAKSVCAAYLQVLCGREKEAEEQSRIQAQEKAKVEAELKAKLEAELKARLAKAEAEKKAKAEAEKKAKAEAEKKAKAEAEKKAKAEAEKKAKAEAEKKAKAEAEKKAKAEAEKKAKAEAEKKAKAEAEKKTKTATATQKSTTQPAKKTSKVDGTPLRDQLATLMWVVWPVAIVLFLAAVEGINSDGTFYMLLVIGLILHLWGRHQIKNLSPGWGSFFIILGSFFVVAPYPADFYGEDWWLPVVVWILCAITGICNGLRAADK